MGYQFKNITNADVNNLLLEDLIIWTNYEIEVAAYNSAGLGVYSMKVTEWTLQGGRQGRGGWAGAWRSPRLCHGGVGDGWPEDGVGGPRGTGTCWEGVAKGLQGQGRAGPARGVLGHHAGCPRVSPLWVPVPPRG